MSGTIKLDETSQPKRFDTAPKEGPKFFGIYQLYADTLVVGVETE